MVTFWAISKKKMLCIILSYINIATMLNDCQQTNCDKLYCSCHPAGLPESLLFESQGNGCKPPIGYWLSIHGNAMIINNIKTSQWVIIDFYWLVELINIHQLIIYFIIFFFLISSSSYWLHFIDTLIDIIGKIAKLNSLGLQMSSTGLNGYKYWV